MLYHRIRGKAFALRCSKGVFYAQLVCVSIALSTMLLKQHSVIDVVFGMLLAFALDAIATEVQRNPQPSRHNRRERQPEWL